MLNNCFKLTSIPLPALIFHLEFWLLVGERLEGAATMRVFRLPNGSSKPLGILRAGEEDWRWLRKGGRRVTPAHLLLSEDWRVLPGVLLTFTLHSQAVLARGSPRGWGGRQRSPSLLAFWFSLRSSFSLFSFVHLLIHRYASLFPLQPHWIHSPGLKFQKGKNRENEKLILPYHPPNYLSISYSFPVKLIKRTFILPSLFQHTLTRIFFFS